MATASCGRSCEGIDGRIREIASPYLLDLRRMNGEAVVHFGGCSDHRDTEILRFFGEIGERAPGSYGLLHVRDDEDHGRENDVLVVRMVRGRVGEHLEPLLSPCIPVLEDPSEGEGTGPPGPRPPALGRRPGVAPPACPARRR